MIMICMMYFDCANCIFIVCAGLPRCLKRFDLYACIIMHMHFCVCTCSICVYIYICVCVYLYICIYIYIYIHLCICRQIPWPFFYKGMLPCLTTQTPPGQGTESAKLPRPKPARSSRAFREARLATSLHVPIPDLYWQIEKISIRIYVCINS